MSPYFSVYYGIKIKCSHLPDAAGQTFEDLENFVNSLDTDFGNIELVDVDFEYKATDDQEGDDTFLIGIKIASCSFLYAGCMKVYTVDDVSAEDKQDFANFLGANPMVRHLPVQCFIYANADK